MIAAVIVVVIYRVNTLHLSDGWEFSPDQILKSKSRETLNNAFNRSLSAGVISCAAEGTGPRSGSTFVLQTVPWGGSSPDWKYARTALAVQSDGAVKEQCCYPLALFLAKQEKNSHSLGILLEQCRPREIGGHLAAAELR